MGKLMIMNNLIILDLNGVLVDKRWHVTEPTVQKNSKNSVKEKKGKKDFKLEINVRPGAQQFIENLSKKYTICVWSSAMKHTIKKILNEIFDNSESITDSISFILTQKSCTAIEGLSRKEFLTDKEYEKYEKKGLPLFMKDIKNIPSVDKFSRILFIDNSSEKLLKNPPDSYHIVETWKKDNDCKETLDDIEDLINQRMIN